MFLRFKTKQRHIVVVIYTGKIKLWAMTGFSMASLNVAKRPSMLLKSLFIADLWPQLINLNMNTFLRSLSCLWSCLSCCLLAAMWAALLSFLRSSESFLRSSYLVCLPGLYLLEIIPGYGSSERLMFNELQATHLDYLQYTLKCIQDLALTT